MLYFVFLLYFKLKLKKVYIYVYGSIMCLFWFIFNIINIIVNIISRKVKYNYMSYDLVKKRSIVKNMMLNYSIYASVFRFFYFRVIKFLVMLCCIFKYFKFIFFMV